MMQIQKFTSGKGLEKLYNKKLLLEKYLINKNIIKNFELVFVIQVQ